MAWLENPLRVQHPGEGERSASFRPSVLGATISFCAVRLRSQKAQLRKSVGFKVGGVRVTHKQKCMEPSLFCRARTHIVESKTLGHPQNTGIVALF